MSTNGNGTSTFSYTAKKWDLAGLQGISDKTLEMHFGLYEGYVKNTNLLNEQLQQLSAQGKASGADPQFAEIARRLGFEYNGMVLHEYYFENLTTSPGELGAGRLHDALGQTYGGFDGWKKDFAAIGAMRGVGWAIAYLDPRSGRISNHWITLHEDGNIAGYVPVVVMDCWEHAFLLDYKPSERAKYIEAFFANIDWQACESRLTAALEGAAR